MVLLSVSVSRRRGTFFLRDFTPSFEWMAAFEFSSDRAENGITTDTLTQSVQLGHMSNVRWVANLSILPDMLHKDYSTNITQTRKPTLLYTFE